MAVTLATGLAIAATTATVAGAGIATKGYLDQRKATKKSEQEIERQKGEAQKKRGSLIRQQRRQLGTGDSLNKTSPSGVSGLTSQKPQEEVLG